MIKRILVPLDGSAYARTATGLACELANTNDAEVVGVAVLDMLGITDQIAQVAPIQVVTLKNYHKRLEAVRVDAAKHIRTLLEGFREMCDQAGVRHHEQEAQGIPANQIANSAAYCDLVIMGLRTFYHHPLGEAAGDSLAQVIDRSATPTLAVPEYLPKLPQTLLLPFDGSHHATRALHTAANFNAVMPFKHVYLATSHQDEAHRGFLLKHAASYLRAHDLTELTIIDTSKDIIDLIHEEYLEKVDIVALGVHAKHTLKDFFVGSLTKSLINYGHLPLLLAQ